MEGDYEVEGDDDHNTEVVDGIEECEEDEFVGMVMRQPCDIQKKKISSIKSSQFGGKSESRKRWGQKIQLHSSKGLLNAQKGTRDFNSPSGFPNQCHCQWSDSEGSNRHRKF
jgi:hypothetical protein